MKKLLVIGNGFDLTIGAKTKYQEYFESDSYCETRKKTECFLNEIRLSFSQINFQTPKTEDYDINCWDLLFYLESHNGGVLSQKTPIEWCDIEKVIHDTLTKGFGRSSFWDNVLKSLKHMDYSSLRTIAYEENAKKSDIMSSLLFLKGWKDRCFFRFIECYYKRQHIPNINKTFISYSLNNNYLKKGNSLPGEIENVATEIIKLRNHYVHSGYYIKNDSLRITFKKDKNKNYTVKADIEWLYERMKILYECAIDIIFSDMLGYDQYDY